MRQMFFVLISVFLLIEIQYALWHLKTKKDIEQQISHIEKRNTVDVPISYENVESPDQELMQYLQPGNFLDGTYDFIKDNGKYCARNCTRYPEPRICYYKFLIEQYHAMGPACGNCSSNLSDCFNRQCISVDGVERAVIVANRQLPGPSIQACFGDRIIVDAKNCISAQTVSLHWHGVRQEHTPWMDGAESVTQCGISEGEVFRYDFPAETTGTLFWHSHIALQMLDGLEGPMNIRRKDADEPHRNLYTDDLFSHTIFVQDWMHELSAAHDPGYNHEQRFVGYKAKSYLINGKGIFTSENGTNTASPLTEFTVEYGKSYRFRIVSATSLPCPFSLTVESHDMKIIATDAYDVEPVQVGSVMLTSAERLDVVIDANKPIGTYWIKVQGYLLACESASQVAVLKYKGSPYNVPTTSQDVPHRYPVFNDVTSGCSSSNKSVICVDQLRSLHPAPESLLQPTADTRITLVSGIYIYNVDELYYRNMYNRFNIPVIGPPDGVVMTDMFNNITNFLPPFPELIQDDPIPSDLVCPQYCSSICQCYHRYKVPLHSVVEVVFYDDSSILGVIFHHSQHVHGYGFRVIKQGNADERENIDLFQRNITNDRPVIKDTVAVISKGFTIIRFLATNPGIWMIHCHINLHNRYGMSSVIQVGERSEFVKQPPNLPKCGNYKSTIDQKLRQRRVKERAHRTSYITIKSLNQENSV